MMSREQGERVLGQVILGTSTRTACDNVRLLYIDLLDALDSDANFRYGYLGALTQRDSVTQALTEVFQSDE